MLYTGNSRANKASFEEIQNKKEEADNKIVIIKLYTYQ